ncbi:hypothetical protein [Chitinophaga pinensis]|uniref:hypothetical protein n=1 Tax=Chitinophaga pinensis TaxID=79329 RepID=UPI0005C55643|nr:hypothetical protein [Chitinophaga pinensis]
MNKMSVNDNRIAHALYQGKGDHLPYAASAHYLINKYISAYWKHDKNDLDFISMELTLCGYLEMPATCAISRKLKLKWIARVLNISPILLHNDPSLPF